MHGGIIPKGENMNKKQKTKTKRKKNFTYNNEKKNSHAENRPSLRKVGS